MKPFEVKFNIVHETTYEYSSQVFLEPHYLRFKPQVTPSVRIESFELEVLSPAPVRLVEQVDAEGNLIHLCWFDTPTTTLEVKCESVVSAHEHNPFGFIMHPPDCAKLPFTYPNSMKTMLAPGLRHDTLSAQLIEYGDELKKKSENNTLDFILKMNQKIFDDYNLESRADGNAFSADETFRLKSAACRDLAWMQIQLLRYNGIAARFVSGYYYIEAELTNFELHAWLEVYLPGAGWLGFDPSHGIATTSSHIPLVRSSSFENTMPVTGAIRGSATSSLNTTLTIEELKPR